MKTSKSIYLIPVLAFLLVMLQRAWFSEGPGADTKAPVAAKTESAQRVGGLGKIKDFQKQNDVLVRTDKLTVSISLQGGAITGVSLTDFAQSLTNNEPFTLLSDNQQHLYIAQSGMSGDADLRYHASHKEFHMQDNADILVVPLIAKDDQGRTFSKTFRFHRGQYHFNVQSSIENHASTPWSGWHYSRLILRHDDDAPVLAKNLPIDIDAPKSGWFTFTTYTGPSYFSDAKPFVKLPFTEVEKKPMRQSIDGPGWIAMQQRYFISAFIPQQEAPHTVTATWQAGASESKDDTYRGLFNMTTVGPAMALSPGERTTKISTFYAGPEDAKRLASLAKGLELTIDYGWLWFISDLLFQGLVFIHSYLGNWGWSIIMITFIVKLAFYKLSESGFRAMAKQKKLQPKVEEINEKFKDDPEQKSKAMIALYQKEQINPVSGCLPTLLQMPVFIALYYVLIESVQLRFQPFLWLPDLAASDPLFIMPALFCLSMLATQKMAPAPQTDPAQANAMMVMPFAMGLMFSQMPSGLLLYWVTNNVLSVCQQWLVTKRYQ